MKTPSLAPLFRETTDAKGMRWQNLPFQRHVLNKIIHFSKATSECIGLFKGQCQKNSISKGRQWKNEPFSEASGQWLDPPIIIVSKPDWVWWWSCGRVTARQYSDARIQNRNLQNSLEPKYFVFFGSFRRFLLNMADGFMFINRIACSRSCKYLNLELLQTSLNCLLQYSA